MNAIAVLLALGCMLLAVIGLLLLSQATTGVGVIGLALVAGVLSRIAQASAYQSEWRALNNVKAKPYTGG